MILRDQTGHVLLDTRSGEKPRENTPTWQPPLPPHSVENVGGGVIHTVQVEIKE